MKSGEIEPSGALLFERHDVFEYLALPPRSAFFSQIASEQAICFEPHIGVPIAVEARLVSALLVLAGQQIADAKSKRQHSGIAVVSVGWMFFGIQHSRGQNRV